MWFLCARLAHVYPVPSSLSEPYNPHLIIYAHALELRFFLLWPRHSFGTVPYLYLSFFFSLERAPNRAGSEGDIVLRTLF